MTGALRVTDGLLAMRPPIRRHDGRHVGQSLEPRSWVSRASCRGSDGEPRGPIL